MRKLCTFALAFAAAVAAGVYLLPGGALVWIGLSCLAAAGLGLLLRGDRRTRTVLLALGLAAGCLWLWGHERMLAVPARALDGAEGTFTAVVDSYPRKGSYSWSATARLTLPGQREIRAILYFNDGVEDLRPGDRVTVNAKLRLADSVGGEESLYYFARGIYLTLSCRGEAEAVRPEGLPLRYWPAAMAQRLRESVAALYPEDAAGLLCALLTGERSDLSESFYAALRRCGLAHVVAVSGMHLTFLAGLVQRLTGRRNRRRMAFCTIPVLALFMALTGFPPSVVRAGVVAILLLTGPALGREGDAPTALSLALMVLLGANPYTVADVGLQLSFASVVGLYLFTPRLDEWMKKKWRTDERGKPAAALLGFVSASLSATVGALAFTLPLSAWYFGTISLIAPLANLLCLWAVSLAFVLGLLSAVLGLLLFPLGQVVALAALVPAKYLLLLAPALARFPYAAVPVGSLPLWAWVGLSYLMAVVWLAWRGERRRGGVFVGVCAVTLAGALLAHMLTFTTGDLSVCVLDVGQGLSVVLHSRGHTVVVDCGGSSAVKAGDTAADYVQSLGSSHIDMLVLTHYHEDHAGGVKELLERVEVSALAAPDVEEESALRGEILALAREKGAEVLLLEGEADVTFGEARMKIYPPLGSGGSNEEGLSVLVSCGSFDALITGDMNEDVEKRLVKYGDLPDTELLVVGHHGSRHSTGEELLAAARPEYAVISVGHNSYGHPAQETLERLAAAGCKIYRTDRMGSVTVHVSGE